HIRQKIERTSTGYYYYYYKKNIQTKQMSAKPTQKQSAILQHPIWKCNHYFEFISVKGKNIIVHCHLCGGKKTLQTAKNSTSNLLKHLKGQHSTVKPIEMVLGAGKNASTFVKLDFSCPTPTVTGEGLKKLVAWYIVENMLPISTVDSPSFWCIIEKIPTNNKASLPHRKMFAAYLEREYAMMQASLKATLEEVGFVSTTADIWTANNRSYMGVTLHWMDRDILKGNKAALACKRLRGRHTFDVIAAELEQIHSSYGLLNKVVATVTDNASNFIEAFKTYQIATSESDDEEEEQEESVTFTDVTEALSTENDDGVSHRCASHGINLISTGDVEKCLTSSTSTKDVYKINIAKCTALWTKASRSTVASEQVQVVSQRKLLIPSSTRWNSFHEAVSRITEIPMNETLKDTLSRMTADLPDVIVKVCSYSFDLLANFGDLLPCTIMVREQSIVHSNNYTAILNTSNSIFQAIQTRFADVLNNKDALLHVKELLIAELGYEFESLNQFPNIKNILLKFNTPTPSSAPVERLFSLGDLVLTPRRNRLSDKRFEKLLLMRYNHCFT
uniref:BED-type domain-containing protein n=1 Tax=Sinocyclocheilus grahami TaxID=75366 RepID=A0A672NZU5_SINGR